MVPASSGEAEVERAAQLLAEHALVLLGVGILTALVALLVVIAAVRLLQRHREVIRSGFTSAVSYARRLAVVEHVLARSTGFLPSGYLAVHLVLGLAVTAAVSTFVVIAENVIGSGHLLTFDLAFAHALRDAVTPGWERFFRLVSWLGTAEAIAIATAAVALRLVIERNGLMAVGWIAAQAGGGVLNTVLKEAFERARPSFADPLLAASSWSFPSGHAMGTFILFGLGCYVLLRDPRSWTVAVSVVILSLAWCVVMAFSRLYLGVHFASDVVAGIIAGVAWVAVCASAFEVVRRRRQRG